ncbi:ATP-binding protein [Butyrivibrio sp. YAB3001]|uniref:ATP-binding protein n=1 Tax=Butyrivibrio sp. YAB3001 TaxID=1520812 RepID=UPI0008F62356|nr:ATP-binding protein [Butyrivibrio sp. YAB3001]SFB73545.1 PD-(D/E)XK nuclease superfamily protein [Butyrivibrio sp. YAB3001]
MQRKLPMGIQSFSKLREENFLYVDKTEYIYKMVHSKVPFFLSRPRRFGKSLLLSTMKAYWEGQRELFKGLKIADLEADNPDAWKKYPTFYFDFNGQNYKECGALEKILAEYLCKWEEKYKIVNDSDSLSIRFREILRTAHKQSGLRCVVLVDEYDKPLLDVVEDRGLQEHNKDVFKGFFSTLKSFDEYIQFVFITGVTKFHKVSIFSDLNQLTDISLDEDFSAICGMTQKEILENFKPEISALAAKQGMAEEECIDALRMQYDGYHFHQNGIGIFNPASLLKAFFSKELGSYWFETGTPTFLLSKIRQSGFDIRKFTDRTIYANEAILKDYTGDSLDIVPLLYQTGYLTIADYDKRRDRYTLCFPNNEVTYGFLESLLKYYVPKATAGNGLDIFTLDDYIENGQLDNIRDVLAGLFASITYTKEADPFEHYFQSVIYMLFILLGKYTECERQSFSGRIDLKIQTEKYIYLFEFKRDDTADAALAQIDSKEYALPFVADSRKVLKIGVSFDSETRKLVGWKVAE